MGFFGGNSSSDNENGSNSTDNYYAEAKRSRTSTYAIFIIIIVAYLAYSLIGQNSACAGQPTTTGRVKLDDNLCRLTEFIFPEHGASDYTSDTIIQEEMVNFYSASGVQPVLDDLSDQSEMTQEELQKAVDDFYDNILFSNEEVNTIRDQGHFAIAFQAANGSYKVAYHVGTDAQTVIDESALQIFSNVLSDNFAKKSGSDVFKNTFKEANSQIMGKSRANMYLIIIVIAIAIIYFAFNFIRNKNKYSSSDR